MDGNIVWGFLFFVMLFVIMPLLGGIMDWIKELRQQSLDAKIKIEKERTKQAELMRNKDSREKL